MFYAYWTFDITILVISKLILQPTVLTTQSLLLYYTPLTRYSSHNWLYSTSHQRLSTEHSSTAEDGWADSQRNSPNYTGNSRTDSGSAHPPPNNPIQVRIISFHFISFHQLHKLPHGSKRNEMLVSIWPRMNFKINNTFLVQWKHLIAASSVKNLLHYSAFLYTTKMNF